MRTGNRHDAPLPQLKSLAGIRPATGFKFLKPELSDERIRFTDAQLAKYQTDLVGYSRDVLGIEPWSGQGEPGQLELFQDIQESVRAQLAGEPHCKVFHVEAGHGVGKTFGGAIVVNWFFDCFRSITITTAPTDDQVRLLLWKDIKTQRKGKGLPGTVLPEDPRMRKSEDWFAIGRTTSDAGGKGTARMQGQHPTYWLYELDEAEGVPDFVFGAVEGMMTGGLVGIVLMQANPQTRTSKFHKKGKENGVKRYRLSCLRHPNVVFGKPVVPGAVVRDWCVSRIVAWCETVRETNEDEYTFTVPFDVHDEANDVTHPAGTIFKPNSEFCFRVLGVAPANLADKVFIPSGRFEAAVDRVLDVSQTEPDVCQIGVDVARFGKDAGTVWVLHKGVAYRFSQLYKLETHDYVEAVKSAALECADDGATTLSIRVDGSGGFGAGVIDMLRADEELMLRFPGRNGLPGLVIHEVQFGGSATASDKYADKATEMYAEAAETIKGISIELPSGENLLEGDLTEREYGWLNRSGQIVKKLEDKDKFRKRLKRSPDDGDGFVLAVGPEFIFDSEMRMESPGIGETPMQPMDILRPSIQSDLDRMRPPGMR